MIARILIAALVLAAPGWAAGQRELALAAGYKAAFVCSGVFNAGQSEAQVAADDLTGIYPEYQGLVAGLPAVVDRGAHRVSVAFEAGLPPRIAVWRPLLGCAQLPIGASDAAVVPRLTPDFRRPDLAAVDAAAWPLGDAGAVVRLRGRALEAVVGRAFGDGLQGGATTTAVIVLKDGKIVAERYRAGSGRHVPQRTWSVAKSLTAALVGRAVSLGRVDLAAPAGIWAAGDPRAAITTEQLLRMNSGLWSAGPGNRSDAIYLGGSAVDEVAGAAPLETQPGTRFSYANNDIMLAALGMGRRVDDRLGFAFTELLWPLGMTRTTPETDWRGNFVLSSQVWMTARDLARLALLYARDGVGPDGTRLLPVGFVAASTAPSGAQPVPATPGRGGYGMGLWLFGPADGVPAGTYGMMGNRGQFAVIVPSRGIIVVRRGFDAPGAGFDPLAFTAAVLAAVPE